MGVISELWSDVSVLVQLAPVNKQLAAYYDAWHKLVDSWIVIQVDDPHWVFRWRLQVTDAYPCSGNLAASNFCV
jgi:pantothenate kinase-related protein Tda10